MQSSYGRPAALAAAAAFAVTAAVMCGGTPVARASSGGPIPGVSNAPGDLNCTLCHTGSPLNPGPATAQITAPDQVVAGQPHTIGVSITNPQNAAKNGFQITVRTGAGVFAGSWTTLMAPPAPGFAAAQTQTHPFNAAYHEHTASGNGRTSWTMQWNAPASLPPGPVVLYACVNDADGDASATGDQIYAVVKKMFQASLTSPSATWPTGALASLTFSAPGRAGDYFFIAPSDDPTPFDLGAPMELQVNPLTGFTAYALTTPSLFIGLAGVLGMTEQATGYVYVPPLPALSGLTLHFAGVTVDAQANATEVSQRFTATFQ
jgi:hypothetical protein